jgi:uncharacterized OB-fold protein
MAPEERREAKQLEKMKKLMARFGLTEALSVAGHCRSCGTAYRPGATVCALCGTELMAS